MASYLYLTVAIALNTIGHLLFKAGALQEDELLRSYITPHTLLGIGAYGLSAIAYIATLRTMPLSVAMPTMLVGYLGAALAAHWIWGEAFGIKQIVAFLFIGVGLFLLHR